MSARELREEGDGVWAPWMLGAGERITMPKRGVNWAFLKINTN
jgi:hypothetical protein